MEAARWAQVAARDRAAELIQDWNSRPVRGPAPAFVAQSEIRRETPAPTTDLAPPYEDLTGRLEHKVMVLERALESLGDELHRPVAEARAIEAAMAPLTGRIRSAIERAGLDFQGTQALGRGISDTAPQPHQLPAAPLEEAQSSNGFHSGTGTAGQDRDVRLEDPYGLLRNVTPAPKRRRFGREGSGS
jgi:hypothetical protein